jgi:hypothetical protein
LAQEQQAFHKALRAHQDAQDAIFRMMTSPQSVPAALQEAVTCAAQPAPQHDLDDNDGKSAMDIDPLMDTESAMDTEPMAGIETAGEQAAEEEDELAMFLGPDAGMTAIWFAFLFFGNWLGNWLTFLALEFVEVSLDMEHRYCLLGRG